MDPNCSEEWGILRKYLRKTIWARKADVLNKTKERLDMKRG